MRILRTASICPAMLVAPRRRRFALRLLATVVTIDLAATLAWTLACVRTAVDRGPRADALVVLWGDDREAGDETTRRVSRAADLWRASRAPLIFCVGGSRPSIGFSGARMMSGALRQAGVPEQALRVGSDSYDTVSNLAEVRALASSNGVRRVLIVADPFQVARLDWFLADRLAPVEFASGAYQLASDPRQVNPGHIWVRVHHEWLAIASLVLPDNARGKILRMLRR